MARVHSFLLATTIVAGLGLSGLMPAGAGPNMPNMPSISAPNISPTRPDFNMRAPNALRDRDGMSPRDPASTIKTQKPKESKKDKPKESKKNDKKGTDTASRGKGGTNAAARTVTPVPIPAAKPGGQ